MLYSIWQPLKTSFESYSYHARPKLRIPDESLEIRLLTYISQMSLHPILLIRIPSDPSSLNLKMLQDRYSNHATSLTLILCLHGCLSESSSALPHPLTSLAYD